MEILQGVGQSVQSEGREQTPQDSPHFRHWPQVWGSQGHPHIRSTGCTFRVPHSYPQVWEFSRMTHRIHYAYDYSFLKIIYSKRIQIKTSQRKSCLGWILLGKRDASVIPRDTLPTRHPHVAICAEHCCTGKLTQALGFYWGSIASVLRCQLGWTPFPAYSSLEVGLIVWDPKPQPSNHSHGWSLWCGQSPLWGSVNSTDHLFCPGTYHR